MWSLELVAESGGRFSVVLSGSTVLGTFYKFELARLFLLGLLNDPNLLKRTTEENG